MRRPGSGAVRAKASEHSSSSYFGYSNFVIPLTSLTSRKIEAPIVSAVFIFHVLFWYLSHGHKIHTQKCWLCTHETQEAVQMQCPGRSQLCSCPHPWPFQEGRAGQGDSSGWERLVGLGAGSWPSILDLTLRSRREHFSGGFPGTR